MKHRSAFSTVFVVLALLLILPIPSCEPLSAPDPPTDYDQLAYVNAAASADTIQADQPLVTQINFNNVCSGSYRGMQKYYYRDTTGTDSGLIRITLGPILHVNPNQQCTSTPAPQTINDTTTFGTPGRYIIAVSGYNGVRRRYITAYAAHAPVPQFALRAIFKDSQGFEIPLQPAVVTFPDKNLTLHITADSTGIWDTTFVESGTRLRYTLNGAAFEATKGTPSNAIVWIQ